MLAEGYMHIQVKSDSYVNTDVLRRVWGNTVQCYTARDAQRCKYGSCKSRDRFPAGDKRIRENINNLENQRLQKSWTFKEARDPTRGLEILLFTGCTVQWTAFTLRWACIGSRLFEQLGLTGCVRVSRNQYVRKTHAGLGPGLPCSEARRAGGQHLLFGLSSPALSSKASAALLGVQAGASGCLICTLQCWMLLFLS